MAKSSFGDDIDAGSVVGLFGAEENPGFGGELTANFADNGAGGDSDGIHGAGGEDEGKKSTDKETDDDFGFSEGELETGHGCTEGMKMNFQLLDVGSKEDEGGEAGGGDGVTFVNGVHGVTHGIELVGTFAN